MVRDPEWEQKKVVRDPEWEPELEQEPAEEQKMEPHPDPKWEPERKPVAFSVVFVLLIVAAMY